MSRHIICAIDQGTTGTTVMMLDDGLNVLETRTREFEQIFPEPGWVEHNPNTIWQATIETIRDAKQAAGLGANDIDAIGITNQRETTVVWDRESGEPIHNAIVWQDKRTQERINELELEDLESYVHKRTGLLLDPYFSGTKLEWILDQDPEYRRRAAGGELAFGTIDSFLLWRLTGGRAHKTDISNASRTLLMNLHSGEWDEELLELFDVPPEMLPEIVGNSEVYGRTSGVEGLADGIPICGMAGDQQAALFGQACFSPGEAKCTFGTGAFLLMNIGSEPVFSEHQLLTSAAWELDGEKTYMLEGSAFIAGAMIQWLRDGLELIDEAAEVERLARRVESSDGVVLVPSLSGLGAPHWKPEAKGLMWGMTRGTTREHVARAALEGIACQNVDILDAMEEDTTEGLAELRVDGGAAANDLLMQLHADLLDTPIMRPEITETTCLGAGLLAGRAAGYFSDLEAIRDKWTPESTFAPKQSPGDYSELLDRWKHALERL